MYKSFHRFYIITVSTLLLGACGGGSSNTSPENNPPSNQALPLATLIGQVVVDKDNYNNTIPVTFYSTSKTSFANEDYTSLGATYVGQSQTVGLNGCLAQKDNECAILSIHQKMTAWPNATGVFSVQDILHDRDSNTNTYNAIALRLKLTGTNRVTTTNTPYVEDVDYDPAPNNVAKITVIKNDANNCLTYNSDSAITMIKRPVELGYTQIADAPSTRELWIKNLMVCPYGTTVPTQEVSKVVYVAKPDLTANIVDFKKQLDEMGNQGYGYRGLIASEIEQMAVYFKPTQSKAKYHYSFTEFTADKTKFIDALNSKGSQGFSYVEEMIIETQEADVVETMFVKDSNASDNTYTYELIPVMATLSAEDASIRFNEMGQNGFRYIENKVFDVSQMYALFEKASNRANQYSYFVEAQQINQTNTLKQMNDNGQKGYGYRGSYGLYLVFIKDLSKTQTFTYQFDSLEALEPNERVDRANTYGLSGYYWFPSNYIINSTPVSMFHNGEYVCSIFGGCQLPSGL